MQLEDSKRFPRLLPINKIRSGKALIDVDGCQRKGAIEEGEGGIAGQRLLVRIDGGVRVADRDVVASRRQTREVPVRHGLTGTRSMDQIILLPAVTRMARPVIRPHVSHGRHGKHGERRIAIIDDPNRGLRGGCGTIIQDFDLHLGTGLRSSRIGDGIRESVSTVKASAWQIENAPVGLKRRRSATWLTYLTDRQQITVNICIIGQNIDQYGFPAPGCCRVMLCLRWVILCNDVDRHSRLSRLRCPQQFVSE